MENQKEKGLIELHDQECLKYTFTMRVDNLENRKQPQCLGNNVKVKIFHLKQTLEMLTQRANNSRITLISDHVINIEQK